MKDIKIILSAGFLIFLILTIVISVYNRNIDEEKIKKNPCYTKCTEIEVITGNKGHKSFKYTYIVDGKSFIGQSAAGDEPFRERVLQSNLNVKYVCNEPKISRLIFP